MNKNQIAYEINECFKDNKINSYFWNNHPVGIAIKTNVERFGHWKVLSRGNTSLAYRKMRYKLAQQQGFEGGFEDFS